MSETSGTTELISSLVINVAIGGAMFLAFCYLRRRIPWLYDIRRIDNIRNPNYKPGEFYLARPPRQNKGFFGWISQSYNLTEDDIAATAGLDAVMTLRFIKAFLIFFSVCTLIAFIVIVPVQATSSLPGVTGVSQLSMSSIAIGSHRVVVHLIVMYVFTGLLCYLAWALWRDNIALKARWLGNEQFEGRRMTVLLEDVPEEIRTDQGVYDFLDAIYPGQIGGVSLLKDVAPIRELALKKDDLASWANHDRGVMELDPEHKRPLHQPTICGGDETKVDAIDTATEGFTQAEAELDVLLPKKHKNRAMGFVTFTSAIAAASTVTMPLMASDENFRARWAPEPREIIWGGLLMDPTIRTTTTVLMGVLHGFIVLFYTIPIAFISSLMTLESLAQRLPFLDFILDLPSALVGFLQGFLPALAMTIFMALLPTILAAMGRLQGIESTVWLEQYVFKKYFVFQLFNFFLLTVFASSVLDQIDFIISNPTEIPNLLARSLPASATVFINYIMLRAFNSNIFEMLDIPRMVLSKILLVFASTPAECAAAWNPDPFKYGRLLPEALLIAIIGFCFATIQPIILPFVAAYFGSLIVWHKHHYTFQHVTPMESGGSFWPLVFNRLILGMVIAQLCFLGLLGLKETPVEAALVVPLIIATLVFWNHCINVYGPKMDNIHLANATDTDKARVALTPEEKTALVEGHPLATLADDIIPMLMPDRYADCIPHEERLAAIAAGEKEPGTAAEKAATARGQAVEGDYGLLYHYKSDGHIFSSTQQQRSPAAVSPVLEDDLELGNMDKPAISNDSAVSLSNRGLTAEQEALLMAVLYRRSEAQRIRAERGHVDSVSRSRSVSKQVDDEPALPGSPALRPSGAMSASCAGDALLMDKYTQQELAPGRYAVELLNPVWSAEYLRYRQVKRGDAGKVDVEDGPEAKAEAEQQLKQDAPGDAAAESPSETNDKSSVPTSPEQLNLRSTASTDALLDGPIDPSVETKADK